MEHQGRRRPRHGIDIEAQQICLRIAGRALRFDTFYAALGTEVRSELARTAGAQTSPTEACWWTGTR